MDKISNKFLSLLSEKTSYEKFIYDFGKYLISEGYFEDILLVFTDKTFSINKIFNFNDKFILQKDYLKNCLTQLDSRQNDSLNCLSKNDEYNLFYKREKTESEPIFYFVSINLKADKKICDNVSSYFKLGIEHFRLFESAKKYGKIFNYLDDAVFIHDSNGKIYDFNNKAQELLGLESEIIYQLNFIELFHNKTLIKRKIDELKFYKETDFDYHITSPTGGKTDINISFKYYNEKNDLILAILKNISEKVWVEEALNRNLTLVLTLLETIPNPIYYMDENHIYLGCNEAFATFVGQPKEKIIGNRIENVASEVLAKKIQELNREILNADKQTMEKEVLLPYPNGEEHYFISTITKFNMQGEKFSGLIGIMVDVTRQKKAEQKLNTLYNNLKHELEIAAKVQKYLLPEWFISQKSINMSVCYDPSITIGGDFYDFIPISDEKYIIYVADISGHGVQAALIMTAVKSIMNILIQNNKHELKLHKIVTQLNRILIKDIFSDNYLTMLILMVDTTDKTARFYNAGHPPLLVYNPKLKTLKKFAESGDIPIGWMPDYEYSPKNEETISFEKDNIYFLYTDGVYECQNSKDEILGFENFTKIIREIPYNEIISFPHRIKNRLLKTGFDISKDDFTLIALSSETSKNSYLKTFKLSYENMRKYVDSAMGYLQKKGVSQQRTFYFELILVETLNNIIIHGKNREESDRIVVRTEYENNEIIIKIWDFLKEWKLPSKNVAKNITKNKYATRGRGFQIIYSLAKDVSLERIADINYLYVKL